MPAAICGLDRMPSFLSYGTLGITRFLIEVAALASERQELCPGRKTTTTNKTPADVEAAPPSLSETPRPVVVRIRGRQ